MTADARFLPFPNNSFDKIVSQDADAWMHTDKKSLMLEINRVLKVNGTFMWQSYATSEHSTKDKTKKLLRGVGYDFNDLPAYTGIKKMFLDSGFSIVKFYSLHDIYSKDNISMLRKALKIKKLTGDKSIDNYINLLQWEKKLFKDHLWTGVLITATKIKKPTN